MDPLAQRVTMEMRGFMRRDGRLIEQDEHVLKMTECFPNELRQMLQRAGFSDIEVRGDYKDQEPTSDTETIVFIARKASREGP